MTYTDSSGSDGDIPPPNSVWQGQLLDGSGFPAQVGITCIVNGLPTEHPTQQPTMQPTGQPSQQPTRQPSQQPQHRGGSSEQPPQQQLLAPGLGPPTPGSGQQSLQSLQPMPQQHTRYGCSQ